MRASVELRENWLPASTTESEEARPDQILDFTVVNAFGSDIFVRTGMEGERKYSPPIGTTNVSNVVSALVFLGLKPNVVICEPLFWPMIGSSPEPGTGNFGLFAQAGNIST
jgi:hypothetical protein